MRFTGISKSSSKFYCKFSFKEHVVVDEIVINVKHCPKRSRPLVKQKWLKILRPSFLFESLTEIIKTLF